MADGGSFSLVVAVAVTGVCVPMATVLEIGMSVFSSAS